MEDPTHCTFFDGLLGCRTASLVSSLQVGSLTRHPQFDLTNYRSQVHTNIIAALQAAGADASLLDTNGNSAQDFDSQRSVAEEVVGGASGGGRLEPPRARAVVPPTGDRDEL